MKEILNETLRKWASKYMGANDGDGQKLLVSQDTNGTVEGAQERALQLKDDGLVARAISRISHQELENQKNLEDIISKADQELVGAPANEYGPEMDEGWFNRFSNFAMSITNEDMKRVWAKILAGEIRRPDTYSIRTLNLMSMLSRKEAEIIGNMAQYVLYDYSSNHDAYILNSKLIEDIKFSDVMLLMELGLLDSTPNLAITLEKREEESIILFLKRKETGLFISTTQENLYVHIYKLTSLGKEIMQLIDGADLNIKYVKEFCDNLVKSNNTISATCAKILKIEGNDVELDEEHAYFKIGAKYREKESE